MNNTEESFINDGGISFDQRKMNAVRAYFEWMPIRYGYSRVKVLWGARGRRLTGIDM